MIIIFLMLYICSFITIILDGNLDKKHYNKIGMIFRFIICLIAFVIPQVYYIFT